MSPPFSLAELDVATDLVGRFVPPTPQFCWPLLSAAVGAEVWVKHENHTPTGAFKVRGGLVYTERHRRRHPATTGLISATRGNHGQSLAMAGQTFGLEVTIVVPFGNSPDKNAAMRGFGATLIEYGSDFQDAREHAGRLATESGRQMVPSFHPDLVLGVATYAREFLAGVPALDVVYVPVGMGSGICAHIAVRDLLGLSTEIVGVVAEGAPATALSFEAGHAVSTETADTFIDGVACRGRHRHDHRRRFEDRDRHRRSVCRGDAPVYSTTHNLAEPAGAAALAGLLAERSRQQSRRVGVTLTGGNLDASLLVQILAGQTPKP